MVLSVTSLNMLIFISIPKVPKIACYQSLPNVLATVKKKEQKNVGNTNNLKLIYVYIIKIFLH